MLDERKTKKMFLIGTFRFIINNLLYKPAAGSLPYKYKTGILNKILKKIMLLILFQKHQQSLILLTFVSYRWYYTIIYDLMNV